MLWFQGTASAFLQIELLPYWLTYLHCQCMQISIVVLAPRPCNTPVHVHVHAWLRCDHAVLTLVFLQSCNALLPTQSSHIHRCVLSICVCVVVDVCLALAPDRLLCLIVLDYHMPISQGEQRMW